MEEGRLATQNLNNKVRDSFKNIDFSGTFMTKEKQNKVLEELKNSLKDKNMKDEDIQKILENVKKNFSNSSEVWYCHKSLFKNRFTICYGCSR